MKRRLVQEPATSDEKLSDGVQFNVRVGPSILVIVGGDHDESAGLTPPFYGANNLLSSADRLLVGRYRRRLAAI